MVTTRYYSAPCFFILTACGCMHIFCAGARRAGRGCAPVHNPCQSPCVWWHCPRPLFKVLFRLSCVAETISCRYIDASPTSCRRERLELIMDDRTQTGTDIVSVLMKYLLIFVILHIHSVEGVELLRKMERVILCYDGEIVLLSSACF